MSKRPSKAVQPSLPGLPVKLAKKPSDVPGYRRNHHEEDMQKILFEFRDRFKDRHPDLKKLIAIINGAYMPDTERIKQVAMGMTEGVADVCLFCQRHDMETRDGEPFYTFHPGLFCELKYGDNDLTTKQEEWRNMMLSENWHFVTCRSAVTAIRAIVDWLEIHDPMIEAYLK